MSKTILNSFAISAITKICAAAALLFAVLLGTPVHTQEKGAAAPQPSSGVKQKTPERGTRAATEAAAAAAQEAFEKYRATCELGTDEQIEAAENDWRDKVKTLKYAILDELNRAQTVELRIARFGKDNSAKAYEQILNDPKSSKLDKEKAQRAEFEALKRYLEVRDKIWADIKREIKAKFTYEGPEGCPRRKEKAKAKENKPETVKIDPCVIGHWQDMVLLPSVNVTCPQGKGFRVTIKSDGIEIVDYGPMEPGVCPDGDKIIFHGQAVAKISTKDGVVKLEEMVKAGANEEADTKVGQIKLPPFQNLAPGGLGSTRGSSYKCEGDKLEYQTTDTSGKNSWTVKLKRMKE